ncbi:MAG: tungstate transport system substrate-binding protein [Thermoproteota archaeon]|nr:tungstate transport system substrate-binding protein [Thermoproteota archaeon]
MRGLATTRILLIAVIIIAAGLIGGYFLWPRPKTQLIVSTTTSLYETGFLDYLKQNFEQTNPGFNVSFISQGTGQAILTAQNGGADLVLVHAPSNEFTFCNTSYGVNRKIISYNFFMIAGPGSDSANINGSSTLDAFKKIKAAGEAGQAIWISRGDGSGTETKEKALWKAAGINYTQISQETSWYLKAGQGMTSTLLLANQKNGYTLSDMASYLNNVNKGNIQLKNFISTGSDLLNVYSAIAVNPQKVTTVKFDAAMTLIRYMVSDAGQNLFNTFGVQQYGGAVFKPCVQILKSGTPVDIAQMIQNYAYLKVGSGTPSECPSQWQYTAGNLYS